MLKKIGLLLLIVIAAVLIYAATLPDTFRVERSASIKAPPAKIFPLINDVQAWKGWSPFENKDPAMKRAFSGPPSGKGAIYEWEGNREIGKGKMEIVESVPPSKVVFDLHFIEPFEGHSKAEFTLVPQGDSTNVTWAMHGPNTYIGKVIGVFCNMDEMIGREFETGLASLKAAAEKT
jgi:uncharacterized protein YndB with AHSA1/START domain